MSFNNIVGQKDIVENLRTLVESVKKSGDVCPGILFEGFSGGGKSTFARATANELHTTYHEVNSSCLKGNTESQLRFMTALESVKRGDVLFLDEIHALPRTLQEILYSALEDGYISYSGGEGWGGKIKINAFTLIGATTHLSGLTLPMQGRFKYVFRILEYSTEDIAQILDKETVKASFPIDCMALAKFCRGNPRQAKNYLDWIKRFCETKGLLPNSSTIEQAMERRGVYKLGLTDHDLKYLKALKEKRIAGVRAISNIINVEEGTVKKTIEPYLLKLGLISIVSSMQGKRAINLERCRVLNL